MKIMVLNHGYVQFVEAWGHGKSGDCEEYELPDYERGIIEAARQSTQGSFRGWERDAKLLEYLYTSKHLTPFEFAGMVIEVQAPIFVFREWHRHRTQSYNEMSARYSPLPELYYRPDPDNVIERGLLLTVNKQAGTVTPPGPDFVDDVHMWLRRDADLQNLFEHHYQRGLQLGIPKELARIGMPISHYSRMRCHSNLRNWLAFLTLRMDPAAQWEIRQYANAVCELVVANFPRTGALFKEPADAATSKDAP